METKQIRIRTQIDVEVEQLHMNERYYICCKDKIKWADDMVLDKLNRLGICTLTFETVNSVPFFLNIPVFGEVVFNCDRRIWQTILFEKVFYGWQYNEVNVAKIYCYFAGQRADCLNRKFVYIWEKREHVKFPIREDLLCCVIEEYLVHLSALGFVNIRYYYYPYAAFGCKIMRNTLKPQRSKYADFLKRLLKDFPDTNDPFDYIQKKWLQSGEELEYIQDIDSV